MPNHGAFDLIESHDPLDYLQPACPCPPEMVREISFVVFDEYINATGTTFVTNTSADYNSVLAVFDQLAVEAVADLASSSSLTLAIALQHSADGETWLTKSIMVPTTHLVLGGTALLPIGYDDGSTPTLGYARLSLVVHGDVSSLKVHIKVTVSVLDCRWRYVEDLDAASARLALGPSTGGGAPAVPGVAPVHHSPA